MGMPLGKFYLPFKEAAIIADVNLMQLRTVLVLFIAYLAVIDVENRWVNGIREHPASAYWWHIHSVDS